ncbi:MAG: DUF3943 domain-containing protein [Bacteroidales bacterium]|nr:DUF3943 domain-containing protein [Bacteroidales bacterium]
MKHILYCLLFVGFFSLALPANAQYARNPELLLPNNDSLALSLPTPSTVVLRHSERTFGNKMLRATGYSLGFNTVIMTALILSPEYVSKWDKETAFTKESLKREYKRSFTTPPEIDDDLFIINYVGHPYQGSFYYNTTRSQGAKIWQASLFAVLQSTLWEYLWEGGLEQPSIQDLIVTPLGGIILGELAHRATLAMAKNGFTWYEIVATCIINPAYVINNGFKNQTSSRRR